LSLFAKTLISCLMWCALLTGCAPGIPLLREDSLLMVERVRQAGGGELFPSQFKDLVSTVDSGEESYLRGEIAAADDYFRFAMIKAELLESASVQEAKRREEAARAEAERKVREDKEREARRRREEELAAAEAAAAAKAAEEARAEQSEARRRAERARYEKAHDMPTRHTVKRGETLPQIAALPEVYGDSSLWPLLYRANRDQIRDPKVLWPGQQLKIPRNLDRNDYNEARRYSSERSGR